MKRAGEPIPVANANDSKKTSIELNQDIDSKNASTKLIKDTASNNASWEPNKGMSSPDSPISKPNKTVRNSSASSKLMKKLQLAENNFAEGCDETAAASSPNEFEASQESFNSDVAQQDWGLVTNHLYMARNPLSFLDLKLGRSSAEVKGILRRYFRWHTVIKLI